HEPARRGPKHRAAEKDERHRQHGGRARGVELAEERRQEEDVEVGEARDQEHGHEGEPETRIRQALGRAGHRCSICYVPDALPLAQVVAMSFGFVINLKVEADKVRSVNRYMEQKAWGAFRYQVFPSYDFAPIAADLKKQHA